MTALKTRVIDEKIIEEVKSSINEKNENYILKLFDDLRAADLADLIEHLEPDERLYLFDLLEPEGAGEVLVEINPPVQESIINELDNKAISDIVQELESDDAADIVGYLPSDRAKEIIGTLKENVSEDLEKLLPYGDDTAGGIMALEYVAVKDYFTVHEAIEKIREKREEVINLYHLWVINESGVLVGLLSLKDLVIEPPEKRISEIMNPEVISVNVRMDQEEVANLFRKYDLVSIPVVDDYNRLVGRITHDDIIDVIEEEADEDISLMAGLAHQEITEDSPFKISRARLPWLLAGFTGELIAAFVLNRFETSLEKVIALAFFLPIIMAMAGSTGTQAATVAVRGLATGDMGVVNIWKRLWIEMRVGLGNGIVCGALLGIIVWLWLSDYRLGIVIAMALMIIVLLSGSIGAAVPLVLKKRNIDPALATGPFVTTLNDVLGLLIYLSFVTIFLRHTA
ncbi:MAG: magnesium transporter [Deltaproteobacteria bacterium]|nr:magnesium transporter [Deltaproteobacteria bacterium]